MRLSLLICCLLLFNTLIGQNWQGVESITKDSKANTVRIEKPFVFLNNSSSFFIKQRDEGLKTKEWAKLPIKKWRYDIGALLAGKKSSGNGISRIVKETKTYFYVGLNRQLTKTVPYLSFNAQLAYFTKKERIEKRDINSIIYSGEANISGFKASLGFQIELLPRRNFSPYIGAGYVYALSPQFKQSLKITSDPLNFPLQGRPNSLLIDARFGSELGRWRKCGFRYNLTEKTRVDVRFQVEEFEKIINFNDYVTELKLPGGPYSHVRRLLDNEKMLILSISRAF